MRRFKDLLKQRYQYYPGFVGLRGWPGLIQESVQHEPEYEDEFHEHEAPGHLKLRAHYNQFDSEDVKHIWKYSKASRDLNQALHELGTKKFDYNAHRTLERHKDWHAGLSKALRKHKTPHDFHVYSGAWFNPENIKDRTPDGKIPVHLHAYTSTSLSHEVGRGFAKGHDGPDKKRSHHYIKLHIPKGSHGGYVQHMSVHPHEYEFLLHHGAKIHIDPTPTVSHQYGEPEKLWHAKLVHDGVTPHTIEGTAK